MMSQAEQILANFNQTEMEDEFVERQQHIDENMARINKETDAKYRQSVAEIWLEQYLEGTGWQYMVRNSFGGEIFVRITGCDLKQRHQSQGT